MGPDVLNDIAENIHPWGKDHCSAGLQFNQTDFDQKRKYVVMQMDLNLLNWRPAIISQRWEFSGYIVLPLRWKGMVCSSITSLNLWQKFRREFNFRFSNNLNETTFLIHFLLNSFFVVTDPLDGVRGPGSENNCIWFDKKLNLHTKLGRRLFLVHCTKFEYG